MFVLIDKMCDDSIGFVVQWWNLPNPVNFLWFYQMSTSLDDENGMINER